MARMNWHPRYHRNALEGLALMSLEERGAYTTILDMIYNRGGPIPDDDRLLAGSMRCSTRLWRTIRARLIEMGKIGGEDGPDGPVLVNGRARSELEKQANRSRTNAESGAKGGKKRATYPPKVKEINDNEEAN